MVAPALQQLMAVLPVVAACVDGDFRVMLSHDIDHPHGRLDLVKRAHKHTGLPGTRRLQHIDLAGIAVED